MPAQSLPQPTRTRADRPDIWAGDDAQIIRYADGISAYPVDIYIADIDGKSVGALHLARSAAQELYAGLGEILMALNVATIEAAGLEVETTPAESPACICGTSRSIQCVARNHYGKSDARFTYDELVARIDGGVSA